MRPTTNQRRLGFCNIFRGIVVNEWILPNPIDNTDFKYNRIIVKLSVEFYHKCWKHRCDEAHNEVVQKARLIDWCRNLNARINEGDLHHLKQYANMRQLNLDQTNPTIIKEWIRGVLKMEQNTKKYGHQDIRNYLIR